MSRHTGYAELPLHGGKAPRWLFVRMVRLSREIVRHLRAECGPQELLRRLSDPFWFQALGCVLGSDWHSSGVTTTTCGALKEALRELGPEVEVFAAGGKGKVSLQTPAEIVRHCEKLGCDPHSVPPPLAGGGQGVGEGAAANNIRLHAVHVLRLAC